MPSDPRLLSNYQKRVLVGKAISIKVFLENQGKMHCCPFHGDRTPSAKLYEDPDGDRLYCFACQKQYNSYDYIQKILSQDPLKYLEKEIPKPRIMQMVDELPEDKINHRTALDLTAPTEQFIKDSDVSRYIGTIYKALPSAK